MVAIPSPVEHSRTPVTPSKKKTPVPVLTTAQEKRVKLRKKVLTHYQLLLDTGSRKNAIEVEIAKKYKVSVATVQRIWQNRNK